MILEETHKKQPCTLTKIKNLLPTIYGVSALQKTAPVMTEQQSRPRKGSSVRGSRSDYVTVASSVNTFDLASYASHARIVHRPVRYRAKLQAPPP